MDKVKKIFSPGSSKDDEVLYGNADERRRESASKAPESSREPEQLRAVEGSDKKEHSILRQLVNPGGEKFDDQRFGTTATTAPGDPNKLETHPEHAKKDHTIVGQVFNPGGDKYDPKRFEATASTEGDRRQSVLPEAPPTVGSDVKLETDPQEKKHEHSILRQIINPGGAKYDQEGYGTTAHAAGSLGNAPSDTKDHSAKDHSVARQILNPGQEKYDPVVHGGSDEPGPSGSGYANPTAGGTISHSAGMDDSASCLSIKSGVAGPFAHGADVDDLGSSSAAVGQSTVPGGQGTDFGRDAAVVGGGAAAAGAGAAAYSNDRPKHDIPSSTTTTTTTTTSQHPQPLADRFVAGGSHINPVGAPESGIAPQAGDSHLGRDAAIAGGAGLAGGAAYSQLNKPKDNDVAAATYTERSQPLAGGSSTVGGAEPVHFGTASTTTPHTGAGSVGGAHVNPIGAPEHSLEGQPRLGQDAALAGSVGAAGIAAESGVTQLNKAPADVQQATYTDRAYPVGSTSHNDGVIHHTQGPHQTETANKLDPHLPGEFPTETGEDKHGLNPTTLGGDTTTGAGVGPATTPATEQDKQTIGSRISAGVAGIASAVGLSSNKKTDEPSTVDPTATSTKDYASSQPLSGSTAAAEQPSEHHYGRDAAIVGGLGAAGAGTYAATRDHDTARPAESQLGSTTTTTHPTATTTTSTTTGTARPTEPQVTGAQSFQPSATHDKANDSHLGRDAAIAGGAGAAGVGAYEASQNTGPASKTIGPHDSNVANIVDPRVQPQPEKMKESTTVGPHSSDVANKADPRVQADPAKAGKDETHYGRDAAVAGGVGATGAGAYAASRDDKPTTHGQPDSNDPAVIAARRAAEKESHPSTSDKHDKSHAEEGGEKKRGLLDKILHPGRKSEDKDHSHNTAKTATDTDGHTKLHKKALGDAPHHETATFAGNEAPAGSIIEPHTGLPMNVEKYGTIGAGGTDGARQIEGYHETDPALRQATHGTAEGAGTRHVAHQAGEEGVAGPDWDAIKKANTPY